MHHNYSTSPIKVLDTGADNWRKSHHFEDEFYEVRAKRLEVEYGQLKEENMLLRRRLLDTDSNVLLLEENSRLKQEVDLLNSEVQRLVMALQATDGLEILLRDKTAEVEALKVRLLAADIESGTEINRLEAQRFLERSRTSMIAETSCDTSTFVDKQLKKLTEDLRKKNQQINELSKLHLSETRRADQLTRQHSDKLDSLIEERKQEMKTTTDEWQRKDQINQERIAQLESELREQQLKNSDLIKDITTIKHEKELLEQSIVDNGIEIQGLKHIIQQQTSQHLREVSQLAASRKRSSKNLGSQRSIEQANIPTPVLAPVSENIGEFGRDGQDTLRLQRAYQLKLQQQQRSSEMRVSALEEQIKRLEKNLLQKQQETKDILTRFIPLLKIQTGELTLEQDRKERMQRHWKADLSILEVLLRQYKIKMFEQQK